MRFYAIMTSTSILMLVPLLLGVPETSAQTTLGTAAYIATSTTPLHVIIIWEHPESLPHVRHFNLYRKENLSDLWPGNPINTGPITVLSSAEIMQVAPDGSKEEAVIKQAIDPLPLSEIPNLPADSEGFRRLQLVAQGNWRISIVIGQGYDDQNVKQNQTYYYQLRAADENGNDTSDPPLAELQITAGAPVKEPAPANLVAQPGDSKVLLLWETNLQKPSPGFIVKRAEAPTAAYDRINEILGVSRIDNDLDYNKTTATTYPQVDANGNTVANVVYSATPRGFVDVQAWDKFGNPTTRSVHGKAIPGPTDGVTFYYKVAGADLLGQGGYESSVVSAKPLDHTPPLAPEYLTVTPIDPENKFEIRWVRVTKDIEGHLEVPPVTGYNVYRYEVADATESAVVNTSLVPQPAKAKIHYATITDASPGLRPLYGEKPYWYRVESIDANNNVGSLSAVASAQLSDISPPTYPDNVTAEGRNDRIRLRWDLNKEPDVDGYWIYRSLCDFGLWPIDQPEGTPFTVLGYVPHATAELLKAATGSPYYDDDTIRKDSPLCYAYLIKASDKVQNKSGGWPIPDEEEMKNRIVCQRLDDVVPPEPAVISGLFARDTGIRVEWIGPPVQDIGAYHVYRSQIENGTYTYVGGMTVEIRSATPGEQVPAAMLTAPESYKGKKGVGCDKIPRISREDMSHGYFIDEGVDPKRIYWYKVVGIDQAGNQGNPDDALPVSTFTFSTKQPGKPAVTVSEQSLPCALLVTWTPNYDSNVHQGFAVFRSEQGSTAGFRQIGSLVTGNTYEDREVVRGVQYWYKVLHVDKEGNISLPSDPMSGKVSP